MKELIKARSLPRPSSAPAIHHMSAGRPPPIHISTRTLLDANANVNTVNSRAKLSPSNRSSPSSASEKTRRTHTRDQGIFQPQKMVRSMTATASRRNSICARGSSLSKPLSPKNSTSIASAMDLSVEPFPNESFNAKLPHKFRREVALLRSQVSFGSMERHATKKSLASRRVSGISIQENDSVEFDADDSYSGGLDDDQQPHYSRKSLEIQMLQDEIDAMRRDSVESQDVPNVNSGGSNAALVSALLMDYYELLQPFVSAVVDTEESDHDRDYHKSSSTRSLMGDPQRAAQSRVLRICCSLDNLLLSVVNRANEERTPQQIAHHSARNLMELFQHALKQLAVFIGEKIKIVPNQMTTTTTTSTSANNNTLQEQGNTVPDAGDEDRDESGTTDPGCFQLESHQMQDLLVNLADRLGKLDAFVRQVFFEENDAMRKQMAHFIKENYELHQQNQQLSCENNELREAQRFNTPSFNLNLSSALAASHLLHGSSKSVDGTTAEDLSFLKSSSTSAQQDESAGGTRESLQQLDAPRRQNVDPREEEEDVGSLKKQRAELERLLKMAQEEIRLSHRDVQVQKERVAELSQSLFKDHEVQLLRGELMNEKRRVRVLEQENVTLREYHLEFQRFQAKQTAANATANAAAIATAASTNQANPATGAGTGPTTAGNAIHQTSSLPVMMPSGMRSTTLGAPGLMDSMDDHAGRRGATVATTTTTTTTISNALDGITNLDSSMASSANDLGTDANATALEPVKPPKIWFYTLIRMDHHEIHEEKSLVRRRSAMEELREFLEQEKPQVDHENALKAAVGAPTLETPPVSSKVPLPGDRISLQRNSSTRVGSAASINDSSGEQGLLVHCRSLINGLYQRQLLVEEDHAICGSSANASIQNDPSHLFSFASGGSKDSSNSFPQTVFCFFLERRKDSVEAEMEACRFMKACQGLRHKYADIALFCEFLEETKTKAQLHLFLWLLQAIERLPQIGIKYPNAFAQHDHFICFFKATYLTRAVYRLLRFQFRTKPTNNKTAGKSKTHQRPAAAGSAGAGAGAAANASAPSSPIAAAAAAMSPTHANGSPVDRPLSDNKSVTMRALETALATFHQEVEGNHFAPLSLEVLHGILEKSCESPGYEELVQCNGMYYRPTGDEKKLPLYVFVWLLLEMFTCQHNWYKKQLQQVFTSLWQEQFNPNGGATLHGTVNTSGSVKQTPKKASKEASKESKTKPKSGGTRKRRNNLPTESQQDVLGITRNFLARFLSTVGVDLLTIDVDWLYVTLLHATGKNAAEIGFQDLFSLLERLDLLPFAKMNVVSITSDLVLIDETKQQQVLQEIQRNWQIQSNMLRVLCLNDPNPQIRKRVTFLLSSIDKSFASPSSAASSTSTRGGGGSSPLTATGNTSRSTGGSSTMTSSSSSSGMNSSTSVTRLMPLVILEKIRGFLVFAWRVVAKRSLETRLHQLESHRTDFAGSKLRVLPYEWCLTEIFFVSRALRTLSEMPTFPFELVPPMFVASNGLAATCHDLDLNSFYDVSRMHCIKSLLSHLCRGSSAVVEKHRVEVQHVLLRFAVILAHVFDCYATTSHFISKGLQLHQARQLVSDLRLLSFQFRVDQVDRIFRHIAFHSANVFEPCRGDDDLQKRNSDHSSANTRVDSVLEGVGVEQVEVVEEDDEVEEDDPEDENDSDLLRHLTLHHSDPTTRLSRLVLNEPCLGKSAFIEFLVYVALEKQRCEKKQVDGSTDLLGKRRNNETWLQAPGNHNFNSSSSTPALSSSSSSTSSHNDKSSKKLQQHTAAGNTMDTNNNTSGPGFSLARLFNTFCRDYLLNYCSVFQEGQEQSFHLRVANPLVARVLLEHRDFLHTIFFGYSKRDDELDEGPHSIGEDDQDQDQDQDPDQRDQDRFLSAQPARETIEEHDDENAQNRVHLGKTKKNSMNFQEFHCFLEDFEFFSTSVGHESDAMDAFVHQVFRNAMCIENEDWSQMEYSEFTSAIAALALFRNPNPFVAWQEKIQQFVHALLQVAHRKRLFM